MLTPGVSSGTRIWLCWRWRGDSDPARPVLPITIMIRQCGCRALEVHHLRPLSTYSSPSRSIRSAMFVASELATSGSVIAKAERISPSSSGVSQRSRLLGRGELVQHLHVARVRRRAVAGLRGDVASARGSPRGGRSRCWRAPRRARGRAGTCSTAPPRARATFSSSITGGWWCGSPDSRSWRSYTSSAG